MDRPGGAGTFAAESHHDTAAPVLPDPLSVPLRVRRAGRIRTLRLANACLVLELG